MDFMELVKARYSVRAYRPDAVPEDLLAQVLEPLLDDYDASFARGFRLLDACPETVLPLDRQQDLLGRLEEARRVHRELLPLMTANFLESNPVPVKAALHLLGLAEIGGEREDVLTVNHAVDI